MELPSESDGSLALQRQLGLVQPNCSCLQQAQSSSVKLPLCKTRAPVLHKARISVDNFGVVDSNRL